MSRTDILACTESRHLRRSGTASAGNGRAWSKLAAMLARGRASPRAVQSGERGTVAFMTALLAVPLIGMSALAVDVGAWQMNVSAMQSAADRAALAAGLVMSAGTSVAEKEARGVAAAHGYVHGVGAVDVAVTFPSATGGGTGVEVVITQPQQRFLSAVILNISPTASVKAVAAPSPVKTCIMALATTGAGIDANGQSSIDLSNCNIHVNSTSSCSVNLLTGSTVKGYDIFLSEPSKPTCASGLSAAHEIKVGASPAQDPYASDSSPSPSLPCKSVGASTGFISISPGTYCEVTFNTNTSLYLSNGTYIFTGYGIKASGSTAINGSKVFLVFAGLSAGIEASGEFALNLTSMTTGPYAGKVIWAKENTAIGIKAHNGSQFALNAAGVIYMPKSEISAAGNFNNSCTLIVVKKLILINKAKFSSKYCSESTLRMVGGTTYSLKE